MSMKEHPTVSASGRLLSSCHCLYDETVVNVTFCHRSIAQCLRRNWACGLQALRSRIRNFRNLHRLLLMCGSFHIHLHCQRLC